MIPDVPSEPPQIVPTTSSSAAIGTGVLGSGRTARSVTYELTVADGRPDRVWLKVTDSSGAAVTGLTVGGTPPGGGLTFLSGSASVTPR